MTKDTPRIAWQKTYASVDEMFADMRRLRALPVSERIKGPPSEIAPSAKSEGSLVSDIRKPSP